MVNYFGDVAEAYRRVVLESASDAAYMDAVERGDMDACRSMVAEAAKRAMPHTEVRDSGGMPMVVYHGTSRHGFNSFATNTGTWMSEDPEYAEEFTDREGYKSPGVYQLYADIRKPFAAGLVNDDVDEYVVGGWAKTMGVSEDELREWLDCEGFDIEGSSVAGWNITTNPLFVEWLDALGFDGMYAQERIDGDVETWCAFDPRKVKSADPVTYDAGAVIPLSKRFDFSKDDIRY